MIIDGISADAPLFNGAPHDDLEAVIKHLHAASYHYADDSGREWGAPISTATTAAEILNRHRLGYRAIRSIHREAKPIMPLDDIVDAVLIVARRESI